MWKGAPCGGKAEEWCPALGWHSPVPKAQGQTAWVELDFSPCGHSLEPHGRLCPPCVACHGAFSRKEARVPRSPTRRSRDGGRLPAAPWTALPGAELSLWLVAGRLPFLTISGLRFKIQLSTNAAHKRAQTTCTVIHGLSTRAAALPAEKHVLGSLLSVRRQGESCKRIAVVELWAPKKRCPR